MESSSSGKKKIRVEIDRGLAELIPGYLANRESDIRNLRQALENGDFAKIKSLGHQMKGSGGGYGFLRISKIGAELEESGKTSNAESALRQVEDLADYIARVEIDYV